MQKRYAALLFWLIAGVHGLCGSPAHAQEQSTRNDLFLQSGRMSNPPTARSVPLTPADLPPAPAPASFSPVIQAGYVEESTGPIAEEKPLPVEDPYVMAWGILGFRAYPYGEQVAPNGVDFKPLFALDLDFNFWVWREQNVYMYFDSRFWGQKPGPGITNPSQGSFDFSKREFDLTIGAAWTYCGNWEARFFAYSMNNLNRGDSLASPYGFIDGVGVENRYYLTAEHERLGQRGYDLDRDSFVSVGFYPTKDLIGLDGIAFKPSFFARAYLTYDLWVPWCYLYLDTTFIAERPLSARIWDLNGGIAVRPFSCVENLEFRLATENEYDIPAHEWNTGLSVGVRFSF